MKNFSALTISITAALAFTSCDSGELKKGEAKYPIPDQEPPIEKTERKMTATKAAQKIALERLAVMGKITNVLKPLRDPEAANAAEPELQKLFAEYHQLTADAAAEGLKDRPLAEVSAHLAPETWTDTRAEFMQYNLLVRQLGDDQRAMIERLMATPEAP